MKISLSKRQKAVLEVMNKPKIPAEIRNQMGLNKNSNLSSTIKELVEMDLLHCLTPKARLGKLYGLTKKGISLSKKLGFVDYHEPTGIDWKLYGWVVCGKQRKAILKGIKQPLCLKYIRENAQNYNLSISRTNCHDILQLFAKTGIAKKLKQNNRIIYVITKMGEELRKQLFRS